jgi:hypothetical protein
MGTSAFAECSLEKTIRLITHRAARAPYQPETANRHGPKLVASNRPMFQRRLAPVQLLGLEAQQWGSAITAITMKSPKILRASYETLKLTVHGGQPYWPCSRATRGRFRRK